MSHEKGNESIRGKSSSSLFRSDVARITSNASEPTWRSVAMHTSKEPELKSAPNFSKENVSTTESNSKLPMIVSKISQSNSRTWEVSAGNLRTPNLYLLEQTHRIIENAKIDDITERIVKVNKEMSVFAQYNNLKASATLQTAEYVEIVINLYNTEKKSKKSSILVEVQRRSGCSVVFHRYSRLILLAVADELDYSSLSKVLSPSYDLPQFPYDEDTRNTQAEEAVDLIKSLLCKKHVDAQYLGIHSLACLTDTSKSETTAALRSSRAVLFGSNEVNDREIHRKIFAIIHNCDPSEVLYHEEENLTNLKEHDEMMLNKALLVVYNGLNTIFTRGTAEEIENLNNVMNDNVFGQLCEILNFSHIRPHDALLAAKSLFILVKKSPEAQNNARLLGIKSVAEKANSFGMLSHAALAKECEGLISIL